MHRMCQQFSTFMAIAAVSMGGTSKAGAAQQPSRDRQIQIVANEICRKGCAQKISAQLYAVRGVKTVEVDMEKRIVSVSLSPQKSATLGQLWHAVEQGEGVPTKLITAEATYTLSPPEVHANPGQSTQQLNPALQIVIDNLHCMGCAKKIGARLYTLKGVTKVSVNLQEDTLTVKARPGVAISPWQAIDAVAKAKERPLTVTGSHGTVSIEWATKRAPKNHQQAQQTTSGGIQK